MVYIYIFFNILRNFGFYIYIISISKYMHNKFCTMSLNIESIIAENYLCDSAVRKDVWINRMYTGSMRITNENFIDAYENSDSAEFKALAGKVTSQVIMLLRRPLHFPHFISLASADSYLFFQTDLIYAYVMFLSLSASSHIFQKFTAEEILCPVDSSRFQVRHRCCKRIPNQL